jgi:hypothetical protein
MKDVGRSGWSHWRRVAWTFQIQHDYPVKVLVLERLEFDHLEGVRAFPHELIAYRHTRMGK